LSISPPIVFSSDTNPCAEITQEAKSAKRYLQKAKSMQEYIISGSTVCYQKYSKSNNSRIKTLGDKYTNTYHKKKGKKRERNYL